MGRGSCPKAFGEGQVDTARIPPLMLARTLPGRKGQALVVTDFHRCADRLLPMCGTWQLQAMSLQRSNLHSPEIRCPGQKSLGCYYSARFVRKYTHVLKYRTVHIISFLKRHAMA